MNSLNMYVLPPLTKYFTLDQEAIGNSEVFRWLFKVSAKQNRAELRPTPISLFICHI